MDNLLHVADFKLATVEAHKSSMMADMDTSTNIEYPTSSCTTEKLVEKNSKVDADETITKADQVHCTEDDSFNINDPIILISDDDDGHAHAHAHHETCDTDSSGIDRYIDNPTAITPDTLNLPLHTSTTVTPSSPSITSPLDRFPLQSLDNNSLGNTLNPHSSKNNSHVDYDYSVVYSGYAGSISAAPSELSFSIDMDASADVGIEMYTTLNKNVDNENDDHHRNTSKTRLDRNHRIKRSNRVSKRTKMDDSQYTFTDNSFHTSFTATKKKMRARRRKMKLAIERAHQASILSEFRAFLSNNKTKNTDKKKSATRTRFGASTRKSQNENLRDKEEEEHNIHDDVELGANTNGNLNTVDKTSLHTPKKRRHRDKSVPQDFCDVPWIVYQNDQEEDLSISTINGGSRFLGGGSFCVGSSGIENRNTDDVYEQEPDVENGWNKLWLASEEKPEKSQIRTRGRYELLYTALIICSIVTLIVVVIVVVMLYNK